MNIYFYQSAASAYGADAYGCSFYQHDGNCAPASNNGDSNVSSGVQTTTQPASPSIAPGAPNTGVFTQPVVFISILLLVGVFVGIVTFLITRKFRNNR